MSTTPESAADRAYRFAKSAILCFGAVRKQPWVHKGKIKARDVTTLALSFDHRLVDGEKGSRFLADVAAVLEDPSSALLF